MNERTECDHSVVSFRHSFLSTLLLLNKKKLLYAPVKNSVNNQIVTTYSGTINRCVPFVCPSIKHAVISALINAALSRNIDAFIEEIKSGMQTGMARQEWRMTVTSLQRTKLHLSDGNAAWKYNGAFEGLWNFIHPLPPMLVHFLAFSWRSNQGDKLAAPLESFRGVVVCTQWSSTYARSCSKTK